MNYVRLEDFCVYDSCWDYEQIREKGTGMGKPAQVTCILSVTFRFLSREFLIPGKALSSIHDTVISKYYGCGLCIPPKLQGATVLDLGCGAGRDVYAISQLVGENGHVIGVDMTEEQLNTANQFEKWHMEKFGYQKSNVEFKSRDCRRIF